MKKENRRLAQEKRAKERKRQAFYQNLKKFLLIGVPSLAVIILVIVICADAFSNKTDTTDSTEADTSSIVSEETADTDSTETASEDNSEDAASYLTDTTLTIENGDTVNIDYVGTIDGVEFNGGNTQGNGTDLTIGSGYYIDDFEEQLIGAHPGDTVEVNVTFPEDYGNEDLNGKDAVFEVIINGIYTS